LDFRTLRPKIKWLGLEVLSRLNFVALLLFYVLGVSVTAIIRLRWFPKQLKDSLMKPFYEQQIKTLAFFDRRDFTSISRVALIELAFQNMKAKKTRTMITVGGMAIGIGAIVFLVSVGYGLEHMVVSRVARLDEMKQTDVTSQTGSIAKINDKTLADFSGVASVTSVLPLIAVVGRVNYQNSISDMAVYGVTTEYLTQSAIKPVEGKIFESNELVAKLQEAEGQVAGVSTDRDFAYYGMEIQDVNYSLPEGVWIRIREKPDKTSNIIGYSKRVEGSPSGEEVWGSQYASEDNRGEAGVDENGATLGKWVKASLPLWKKEKCSVVEQPDCTDGGYLVSRDASGLQEIRTGYFAPLADTIVTSIGIKEGSVLALTTDTTTSATGVNGALGWVEIASEAGVISTAEVKKIDLGASALKQAVVNRSMLKVLGLKESEAVGKVFTVSFVVVGDLLDDPKEKVESSPAEFKIVGVVPDEKSPVFYVPFVDLRTLGITNYSQVKVVVKDQSALDKVRRQIEGLGYSTRSVADTVSQITSLFGTVRVVLGILGMVALAVASLGMFNTLTVSLLERTREVGLMKAMGMKSTEVQELFLTESMMMGFFGGVLGIFLGYMAGKVLGLLLSTFAIFKGVGYINISFLPITFVLVIILLSFIVGMVTGIYPARRATKISALNALRYE